MWFGSTSIVEAALLFHMFLVGQSECNMPFDATSSAIQASADHDLDPAILLGYLCSEHQGGRWSGKASAVGATGYYQIVSMWPREFGYTLDQRDDPWLAADMAAQIVLYSMESHDSCSSDHDWRAHMKCGSGARNKCTRPVRAWERYEDQFRSAITHDDT